MGFLESLRGLLWARRRSPEQVRYFLSVAHERFQPDELLRQAVAGEHAGFDAVCCSDHLEPWWAPDAPTPAACGNAWVWLGAAGHATQRVALGTAGTRGIPPHNPGLVAPQGAAPQKVFPRPPVPRGGASGAVDE